jgi:hypothetical protein
MIDGDRFMNCFKNLETYLNCATFNRNLDENLRLTKNQWINRHQIRLNETGVAFYRPGDRGQGIDSPDSLRCDFSIVGSDPGEIEAGRIKGDSINDHGQSTTV